MFFPDILDAGREMAVRTYVILCRLLGWLGGILHTPLSIHLFLRDRGGPCKKRDFKIDPILSDWIHLIPGFILHPGTSLSCW